MPTYSYTSDKKEKINGFNFFFSCPTLPHLQTASKCILRLCRYILFNLSFLKSVVASLKTIRQSAFVVSILFVQRTGNRFRFSSDDRAGRGTSLFSKFNLS